ncbi:MAG: alpha-L-fucosidase [Verrucomicrobia bacterium]|nr:alpha-L-fucosidase [Verrucomicrobiota bacterium]
MKNPSLLVSLICPVVMFGGPLAAAESNGGETIDPSIKAVSGAETLAQRDARMKWWRDAKFGMFIHWGVYAVPARNGEWVMHKEKIPVATYRRFAQEFNPVRYDPVAWARLAKDAGMRYMVITSKHHEGFALFPSDATDWDIADATPYGMDLLGPLVKAAHGEGLKIGFYYSQAQDWTHPGGAKSRYNEGEGWDPAQQGSFDTYLKSIAIPQTRELITRYNPDIFWWDTPTWMNVARAKPLHDIVATVPGIITNNRLGGGYGGDTKTPEQFVPITGYKGDWETCMTIGNNWGYVTEDMKRLKPSADLIRKLADICSKGGNFLLNVGPRKDGTIDEGMAGRLLEMGKWVSANGESIYGTTAGPFRRLSWGCATRKGNTLYLHVFDWPKDGKLRVPLENRAVSAHLLTSPASRLKTASEPGRITIDVPATPADPADTVVVLTIEGSPDVPGLPTLGATATASAADGKNIASNVFDGTGEKRWLAPKTEKSATLEIILKQAATISAFGFDEPDVWPRRNQKFTLSASIDGQWREIAKGSTNGHGKAANITPVTASKFRLDLECDAGAPGVAELELYRPE